MGYYIRILTPSARVPSLARARAALARAKLAGVLKVESGTERTWTHATLAHRGGPDIADIERNAAPASDLVAAEVDEFLDEIKGCKPAAAAAWLTEFLPTVRTIYAIQLLRGTEVEGGWDILGAVKESIFAQVGGILQADGEGFSNPLGYHILWQFSDSVTGPWWMGVLRDGEWVHFQMDLGKRKHRAAFRRGEVPEGVVLAE